MVTHYGSLQDVESVGPHGSDRMYCFTSKPVSMVQSQAAPGYVWDAWPIPYPIQVVKVELVSQAVANTPAVVISDSGTGTDTKFLLGSALAGKALAAITEGAMPYTALITAYPIDVGVTFAAGSTMLFRYITGVGNTSVGTVARVYYKVPR